MLRLPGLIDVHVHMREPGATYKEDWQSGTSAAIVGGYTAVLAMPNTDPAITDTSSLLKSISTAKLKACCDYAQFIGAGKENASEAASLAQYTAGLKMYLDQTYGPLCLDNMMSWMMHFEKWPRHLPIAVHAEGSTVAAVILMAVIFKHSVHICHVSRREEILLIKAAKNSGIKLTCEVTPHHLLLTEADVQTIGEGRAEVRPRLASESDRESLWENFDVIDCIATDHAPHTLSEKDDPNPPPGFPGLETALPLLLTAIKERRKSLEDLITKMCTNPRKIFCLSNQKDTWIEVDSEKSWEITSKGLYTRCAWTPFEGWRVTGKVRRVVLRGQEVFIDGKLIVSPGTGKNLRPQLN